MLYVYPPPEGRSPSFRTEQVVGAKGETAMLADRDGANATGPMGRPSRASGNPYKALIEGTIALQERNIGFAQGMIGAYMGSFFAPLTYPRSGTSRTIVPGYLGREDGDLPLKDYDELTVEEVSEKLGGLYAQEVWVLRSYEERHQNRRALLELFDRALV